MTAAKENLQELVAEIQKALLTRGEMLATAESCTGGLIASEIVNVAGSSAVFAGGIVAYQNLVKHDYDKLMRYRLDILEKHGAVSRETVEAMARGAREKFHADWAVATSGIAGPGGAEPGKPVGTVWMCVNSCLQNESFCKIFAGNRQEIREKAVYYVLGKLLFLINNQ